MPREIRDLLHDTAVVPSRPLEAAEVMDRGARLRLRRRGGLLAAAVGVPIAAVVLVSQLMPQPRSDVIFQPNATPSALASPAPTSSEPAVDSDTGVGPRLSVNDLPQLPQYGIALHDGDRLVLVGTDGTVHGHIPRGRFATFSYYGHDPRRTGRTHLLRIDEGPLWLEPHTGRSVRVYENAAPLVGATVNYIAHSSQDEAVQLDREDEEGVYRWPANSSWSVSPDHRVVTWDPCSDGDCAPRFYRSDTATSGELERGCRAADAGPGQSLTLICDDGRSIVAPSAGQASEIAVPSDADGRTGLATAVYDSVVRVDMPDCRSARAFVIANDKLVPLPDASETEPPSAAPLGVLPDGRVVLHYNTGTRCGPAASAAGVYVLDSQTGQATRIWAGALGLDEAQMWAPTGVALP